MVYWFGDFGFVDGIEGLVVRERWELFLFFYIFLLNFCSFDERFVVSGIMLMLFIFRIFFIYDFFWFLLLVFF